MRLAAVTRGATGTAIYGLGEQRRRTRKSDMLLSIRSRKFPKLLAIWALFRPPAIRLRAGPAHQHRPFSVAEAVSLHGGLNALLVVDSRKRARPVGAPLLAEPT
jgi:hypothetical protein